MDPEKPAVASSPDAEVRSEETMTTATTSGRDIAYDLPVLMRPKTPAQMALRNKYPYSSHREFDKDKLGDVDPYSGLIVWAKMGGHPPWPARLGTQEDLEILGLERIPGNTVKAKQTLSDDPQNDPQDQLFLYFLGTHEVGVVRREMTEPYLPRYRDFSVKSHMKPFFLALEEADAVVMQSKFPESRGMCMICSGVDDPDKCILCDRCNSEAHFRCTVPPLSETPPGAWICPVCFEEAPLSTEYIASRNETLEKVDLRPPRWTLAEDKLLMQLLRENLGNVTRDAFKVLEGRSHQAMRSRHKYLQTRNPGIPSMDRFRQRAPDGKCVITDEEMVLCLAEIDRSHARLSSTALEPATRKEPKEPKELKEAKEPKELKDAKSATAERPSNTSAPGIVASNGASSKAPSAQSAKKLNLNSDNKKDEKRPSMEGTKRGSAAGSAASNKAEEKRRTEMLSAIFADAFQSLDQRRKEHLDEENINKRHRKAIGQRQWIESSDVCFVCWRPGAEVSCSDPWCDRVFHSFCLGSEAPSAQNQSWTCPWHHCAVCRSQGKNYPPISLPEETRCLKIPTVAEATGTVRWRAAEVSPIEALKAQGQDISHSKLSRCCGCPFALCMEHLCVSTETVFVLAKYYSGSAAASSDGSDSMQERWSIGIERQASDFFACERCAGLPRLAKLPGSDEGGDHQQLPRVELARSLDQFLSEFVCQNLDLTRFALRLPSREIVKLAVGEENTDPFFALSDAGLPLSLDRLQRKIRLLNYASVKAFQTDFQRMVETLSQLYEIAQVKLSVAARTFMDVRSKMERQGFSSALLRADERSKQDEMLFRRVQRDSPNVRNNEKLLVRGLAPWESYGRYMVGEKSAIEAQARLEHWTAAAYKEATLGNGERGALQVLSEASRMARMINFYEERQDLLIAPTREEVEAAFEAHMDHIRGALMTGAILRNQLGRVLDVVDSVDPSVIDLHRPVLNIGGERLNAEQRAANRALQARLDQTQSALFLERQARQELEQKVKRMEKRLRMGDAESHEEPEDENI